MGTCKQLALFVFTSLLNRPVVVELKSHSFPTIDMLSADCLFLLSQRLDAYYSLFRDIALMLGADEERVDHDVKSVRDFENRIAYHKFHDWDFLTLETIGNMKEILPGVSKS